jgi:hypothetical protein
MRVRIDQPGQNVLAGGVDLRGAGAGLRAPRVAAGHGHRIERDHLRDGSVLDHDVVRPLGRRAVAVDDDGVANDQARGALTAHRGRLREEDTGGARDGERRGDEGASEHREVGRKGCAKVRANDERRQ